MAELVPPSKGDRGVDIQVGAKTYKYTTKKDGTVTVQNPNHIRQLKAEGYIDSNKMGVVQAVGHPCKNCGFGSFFVHCSRCGADNSPEEMVQTEEATEQVMEEAISG